MRLFENGYQFGLGAELENEVTARRVKSAGVRTQPGNLTSTESHTVYRVLKV